jgi:hypothetical protein
MTVFLPLKFLRGALRDHVDFRVLNLTLFMGKGYFLNHSALKENRNMATRTTTLGPTTGIIIIGDEILKGQTQVDRKYFEFSCTCSFNAGLKKII